MTHHNGNNPPAIIKRFLDVFRKEAGADFRHAPVKIGDRVYTVYAPKEDVYLDQVGAEFEPAMVKVYQSLIHPDFACLDIGANIGCTSLLFGAIARRVDSFEPSPTTFRVLSKNIRAARLRNVSLHNVGLGSSNMETKLAFSPDNRSGGFVANRTAAPASHTVETIHIKRLDDWYSTQNDAPLNFIKMDVEGFEKSVIEGGLAAINRQKPVVVLELNHWCLNAFQRITVPDFFDFLRAVFPYLYAVNWNNAYADLHNDNESFYVMYEHILHNNFGNLVGAFDEAQLVDFRQMFRKIEG